MGLFDRFKPKKKPSPQPEVPFQPGANTSLLCFFDRGRPDPGGTGGGSDRTVRRRDSSRCSNRTGKNWWSSAASSP